MLYILAILTALLLSAFQYLYKRKALWFFIWRFLTYLVILLLLINPKWTKKKQIITKPQLYVLADNTMSIKLQNDDQQMRDFVKRLKQSKLSDKFKLHFFKFDQKLSEFDSLDFSGKQTAIGNSLAELKFLHQSDQKAPVILLTDGQNTSGTDYVYGSLLPKSLKIFPVVYGDTVTYSDLRIDLVNTNPYVYKDNYFPVEIFVTADIEQAVNASLKIIEKGKILFHKTLHLSPNHNSAHISTKLKAGSVGLHSYQVLITGLTNEKKTLNNRYYFNIEVLKNAQKILLLSDIIHPDIGAIKRSLKKYPYIKLEIKKPTDNFALADYQSVILYQPTAEFASIFTQLKKTHKAWWLITGKHTDWTFLNGQKLFFNKPFTRSFENYFPVKNTGFGLFKLPDLNLEKMPPLQDFYGQVKLSPATEIAYYSKINNVATQQPLLVFNTQPKQVVLFGENIWQWAMQAGVNQQQNEFNQLVYQIIQYLSINKDYERLQLQYQKQIYQAMPVVIIAKFLDKNLESDTLVKPELLLYKAHKVERIPMTLKNDFFQAQIDNLPAGSYRFTVQNKAGDLKKNGSFNILAYSIEKQNLQANVKGLKQLAQQSGGKVYFSGQAKQLLNDLLISKDFHSRMHYETSETPLIDYRYLLVLLVLLLSTEWLIKKLRGEL